MTNHLEKNLWDTLILPATDECLQKAAEILQNDNIVAFPTETVYGLGANALSARAVEKIFLAKGRPNDNPLIIHVATIEEVEKVAYLTPLALELINAFWPGPLTLVLKAKDIVPPEVNGGLDTVAVRMPSHPVARRLLEKSALPIAAPSANLSGKPSPTNAPHVLEDMNHRIPLIIDGGECEVGLESTVLNISEDIPVLLRPGAITEEDLTAICGKIAYPDKNACNRPAAPGMKYRHYAPQGDVFIFQKAEDCLAAYNYYTGAGRKIRFLVTNEMSVQLNQIPHQYIDSLGFQTNPENIAKHFFAALRNCDTLGIDVIMVEEIKEEGIGKAIMNRLRKAAAK